MNKNDFNKCRSIEKLTELLVAAATKWFWHGGDDAQKRADDPFEGKSR